VLLIHSNVLTTNVDFYTYLLQALQEEPQMMDGRMMLVIPALNALPRLNSLLPELKKLQQRCVPLAYAADLCIEELVLVRRFLSRWVRDDGTMFKALYRFDVEHCDFLDNPEYQAATSALLMQMRCSSTNAWISSMNLTNTVDAFYLASIKLDDRHCDAVAEKALNALSPDSSPLLIVSIMKSMTMLASKCPEKREVISRLASAHVMHQENSVKKAAVELTIAISQAGENIRISFMDLLAFNRDGSTIVDLIKSQPMELLQSLIQEITTASEHTKSLCALSNLLTLLPGLPKEKQEIVYGTTTKLMDCISRGSKDAPLDALQCLQVIVSRKVNIL
jgi:hypothetical protein